MRPLRDNPAVILFWIVLLLAALVAMIALADRSAQLSPDFLSEVVLYALSVADLTILVALVFVLARNIIKLVVERRRALPFARFRSKLVAVLLGMTLIPASLVLVVGSELIRNSAARWFSAPIDEVLSSARQIASDYYLERETAVAGEAARIAASLTIADLTAGLSAMRDLVSPEVTERRVDVVEVYRLVTDAEPAGLVPVVEVVSPAISRRPARAAGERLALQVAAGSTDARVLEPLGDGGELVRAAVPVRDGTGRVIGVVVAGDYLTGELARHSRRIVDAYEGYQQLRVLRRPLEGVYLSFFLMVTLLILVGATWMGLYLAKRITRPIQMLAEGAREIGAGHLDHRIEPETTDEFGALVEAFNHMAEELALSQRRLERSRRDLEDKNREVEARRRYIETILERIATGVVSFDDDGRVSTINGAALRLLGVASSAVVGRRATDVFGGPSLEAVGEIVDKAMRDRAAAPTAQEVALVVADRELHLAVATTPLVSETGPVGLALVLDDVTPLIRAQKVAAWRDVARRLAHEVKNPLTPIQLCAERLKRHFSAAPEPQRRLVDECSSTIVAEVESLKRLVDEFSQFARMPAPRTMPSDLNALLADALRLYDGLFARIRVETRFAAALPPVRVDAEQFRRVVINLVDNAVEALGASRAEVADAPAEGLVSVETTHDAANGIVRVVVADNGPGIPAADRAKLFMPYYSTKQRGSGLGLAIVRRIILEHGGSIEATDNVPQGTRVVVELPCATVEAS